MIEDMFDLVTVILMAIGSIMVLYRFKENDWNIQKTIYGDED